MALATVDKSGQPHCRMVLLKGVENSTFRFYTNYKSRKANNISENHRVSLCFYWEDLERQVRIEGTADKLTAADSDQYFAKRPRGAQIGAWVSKQSRGLDSYASLIDREQELQEQFRGTEISRPNEWGGYAVTPTRFEFWKGVKNRIHRRREYTLDQGVWTHQMLQP
ncbi:UNVERIFIED_CONTAM: hypothetical protein GTU68_036587 [Idotea baltica]|nr:hypothetical protein [Idotea baltica]